MLQRILLVLILIMLAGCTGETCYDADDFGFANLTVSARYSKEELEDQQGENQVGPWRDSSYRVNGRPLVILVRHWDYETNKNRGSEVSAWCPWFGHSGHENKLSDFCHRLQDCTFIDGFMCSSSADARISNAPCILRKGVGLYALIAEREYDPNLSLASMREPAEDKVLTFHLGVPPAGYEMLDISKDGKVHQAGGRVYLYDQGPGAADALKQKYTDGKLYFKILDKFYDDNSGQYRISIKSGVTGVNPDPITYVINLVKDFIFGEDYGLIRRLYQGLVENTGFRYAVSGLLTLYIIWTALSYLSGNIELSQNELVIRVAKIGLVSALISTERSWSFFYDNLFVFFVGGVQQVLDIIVEAGASGPGAPGILAMMIAPQTFAKLSSLLFVDWLGFIYIILFFIALFFVMKIFFDAAIIYLTALLTVGLIIAIAPIFICFLLFQFTRSLFENWLKQLISYAVQPIILFTGLVFISFIIRDELYGSLGFRVCKHYFPNLAAEDDIFGDLTEETLGTNLGSSIFFWWFPEPMKGERFTDDMANIAIPIDHFDSNGNFCEAYGCFGLRYPDLPFLDPDTTRGQDRRAKFKQGKFVQLDGLLLIFVALYLLHQFNGLTISMAKFITGTSGNLADIGSVRDSAVAGKNHSLASLKGVADGAFAQTKVGKSIARSKIMFSAMKETIKAAPEKFIDKHAIRRLEKQAVSSSATSSVLKEVEARTGLKQSDVIKGSDKKYQKALASNLRQLDPSLTNKQAITMAKTMSKKRFGDLEQEFASARYGKDFSKLSQQEQAQIKGILGQKHGDDGNKESLRKLAMEARNERRFKNAYVDAHQGMSNRGIGVFGKNVRAIQALEEFKHQVDTYEKNQEFERKMYGQKLMSGVEGIKSGAYERALGNPGDKGEFGKKYFGGGYHDINKNDPALRTYDEVMKEQRDNAAREKIDRKIDAISANRGKSVISPEFLNEQKENKDYGGYEELARRAIDNQVHRELTSGSDPILKGEKYMRNYAKDSELAEMVDRTMGARDKIFQKDEFINRQEDYEYKVKQARSAITKDFKDFREAFGTEINPEKMPEQLESFLEKRGVGKDEINSNVDHLKANLDAFQKNQEILQKIDERKQMVVDKLNKEIEKINEVRKDSGMEAYYGKASEASEGGEKSYTNTGVGTSSAQSNRSYGSTEAVKATPVRAVRKIEDHLRGIK